MKQKVINNFYILLIMNTYLKIFLYILMIYIIISFIYTYFLIQKAYELVDEPTDNEIELANNLF